MAIEQSYDPDRLPEYKPIEAYGLIGDCRTAALVGVDGSVDWACFPDFDSPAVFAAILDPDAGRFSVRPREPFKATQRYESGTNVLVTRFETQSGTVRVRDFMPMLAGRRLPASEIHRQIEGVRGSVPMRLVFEPRMDYGSQTPHFEKSDYGVLARGKSQGKDKDKDKSQRKERLVSLASPIPLDVDAHGARADFDIVAGEQRWLVVDWDSHAIHPVVAYRSERRLKLTRAYWRRWVAESVYQGDYREQVERSLLTLKLLSSSATGGFIAAPTTSLPEWVGGSRNWDYRYAWVRDSAFIMHALFNAGYVTEGTHYFDWVLERCLRSSNDGLKIMYSVRGERELPERELGLRGYRDSRPARVGNAASDQFQLDIYGSLIETAVHYQRAGGVLTMVEMERLARIVEFVREHWREPDDGIWEARGHRQHYTYSKVWAWVTLDRAWRAVRDTGLKMSWKAWRTEADAIREDVLTHAYNKKLGAFTQYYGSDILDSAVLIMPITGIIDADDPRFHSTREVICRDLAAGPYPLLYRYDPQIAKDGVGGPEGAFLLPSFWLVEDLELAGMHREAVAALEALLRFASPLGLYSEELHPKNQSFLGNFPQGFSHLGLINAALRLESGELIERVQAHS